jgi:DNA-binding transcriptional MerR regulator
MAARAGISPDSLRHYERLGLLPPPARNSSGYRLYSPAAVERLQLIRSAVRVGFSLRQLAEFLAERQAGGAPCRKVRGAAERILASVDDQIAELHATKAALAVMVREWDDRLARTPANTPAHLLHAMTPAASLPMQTRQSNRPRPRC